MINFRDQVPSIYTSASRDFQYLGWLINIVLNAVKHNVDDLYDLPVVDSNSKITELLALTLGFKIKRNYDKKQLITLISVLPGILKYKGTAKAVELAANALVAAAGSLGDARVDTKALPEISVTLPKDLVDITLFLDLLDYILPAGITCHIRRADEELQGIETRIEHVDTLSLLEVKDIDLPMYNVNKGQDIADFSANILNVDVGEVNTGLVSNTIIPAITGALVETDNYLDLYTTEQSEDGSPSTKPLLVDSENETQLRVKKNSKAL